MMLLFQAPFISICRLKRAIPLHYHSYRLAQRKAFAFFIFPTDSIIVFCIPDQFCEVRTLMDSQVTSSDSQPESQRLSQAQMQSLFAKSLTDTSAMFQEARDRHSVMDSVGLVQSLLLHKPSDVDSSLRRSAFGQPNSIRTLDEAIILTYAASISHTSRRDTGTRRGHYKLTRLLVNEAAVKSIVETLRQHGDLEGRKIEQAIQSSVERQDDQAYEDNIKALVDRFRALQRPIENSEGPATSATGGGATTSDDQAPTADAFTDMGNGLEELIEAFTRVAMDSDAM